MNFKNFHPANIVRAINWRAAIALFVLLTSWSATPVSQWAQPLEYCSMECCVADGHCCCASQKPFVEGQDHSGVGEIGQVAIQTSCPCPATPSASAKVFSRQIPQTLWHDPVPDLPLLLRNHRRNSDYSSLHFSPRSPRAPPARFLTA
ncbi:MAG TPA: hypothetical protein VGB07_21040 [Blastocatellia bacterium]